MVDLNPAHTDQQRASRPRPAPGTPRRSPTPAQEQEDGSISIAITVPAYLAADTDISVVLTPRRSRTARVDTLPQIIPLRFPATSAPPSPAPQIAVGASALPATPSPSPVRQRVHRRDPVVLNSTDPVYPRPLGSIHPYDPVPSLPTRSRRFYIVFKGSKIGVFWDSWSYVTTISKNIRGQWRKAETYEQAVNMWERTDASEREVFTAD